MSEPTNPLFDHEKEFLERKKLEYERALRGDVEEIKEQTIHVGKLALVGAGVAGGVWLLVKAFGGGSKAKSKKKGKGKHKPQPASFEDYAGFDGYGDETDPDQGPDYLSDSYQAPEDAYGQGDHYAEGEDDNFYGEEGEDDNQAQYDFGPTGQSTSYSDPELDDDNGLSAYPDFPTHSGPDHGDEPASPFSSRAQHGQTDVYHTDEDHGYDEGPAHSFASAHSYQARPYDDSRRLPESNSFADLDEEPTPPQAAPAQPKPAPGAAKRLLPMLMAFAQTDTGKVVIAQAAAVAMAFVGKKLKDILPGDAAETGKNADLATSSAPVGVVPAAQPVTTAAQDVSAAALPDDTLTASLSAQEPLA